MSAVHSCVKLLQFMDWKMFTMELRIFWARDPDDQSEFNKKWQQIQYLIKKKKKGVVSEMFAF